MRRVALALMTAAALTHAAEAQPLHTMTYRGPVPRLASGGPARATDLVFRVLDAPTGGAMVAGPYAVDQVASEGDGIAARFGPVPAEALAAGRRWLEVSVAGTAVARVEIETVHYDGVDDQGRLTGGVHYEPIAARAGANAALAYTAMLVSGPTSNRIDMVFVGDGYQAGQLGTFALHAQSGLDALLQTEPFHTYQTFFNAYRVDVVSTDAGVDNDPTLGVARNTAMDMGFWCGGIERLLCVNTTKAYAFAAGAPAVDHVLAVANSTKYGGAGYGGSDLATYSGGNGAAPEVAIHEIGHSLGALADEYDYGDGATYAGGEHPARNTSRLTAPQMAVAGTKWAVWLDDPSVGFDGPVSCFQGSAYYQYGLYRPTTNSKMRSLGRPFNLPSIEGLLIEMYRIVSPIDAATPPGTPLSWGSTVFVDPVDPIGQPLAIQWLLDGATIGGQDGTKLAVDSIGVAPGVHTLSVRVRDETPWVRDEAARDEWMTATRSWTLTIPAPAAADGAPARGPALSVSPAPFDHGATLHVRLAEPGRVRLVAYDLAGRTIAVLRDGLEAAGEHRVAFDARGVAPGLVVFRLETEAGTITRKAPRIR